MTKAPQYVTDCRAGRAAALEILANPVREYAISELQARLRDLHKSEVPDGWKVGFAQQVSEYATMHQAPAFT